MKRQTLILALIFITGCGPCPPNSDNKYSDVFANSTYEALAKSDYLEKDNDGRLTEKSIGKLYNILDYYKAVHETRNLNDIWKSYVSNSSIGTSIDAKQLYYSNTKHLTNLSSGKGSLYDTTIGNHNYILMLAWKSKGYSSYLGIDSSEPGIVSFTTKPFFKFPFFVTSASDMHHWIYETFPTVPEPDKCKTRLKQLLGLPPTSTNDVFVELWIRQEDLFRPAIDSSMNFNYLPYRPSEVYLDSFIKFSEGSFSNKSLLSQYPFSGLGYTWDWNPDNAGHIGLSEFIINGERKVYIRREASTEQYINLVLQAQ